MEFRNKFEKHQNELQFESQNYRNGKFIPLAGGRMWQAKAEPRTNLYEPITISGPSREVLIGRLAEKMPGFRLYRVVQDDVRDEMDAIRAEREAARKAAAVAPKPKPKQKIFGADADSPEAQQIAQREAAAFVRAHSHEHNFILSPFNQTNLMRRMTECLSRGDFANPTAEAYESCYQFLVANGFWEGQFRKRGQPAARIYYAQAVQPKPTQEEIEAQQQAAEREERRRLEAMPFEDLRRLYESKKGRTRDAAFPVNR